MKKRIEVPKFKNESAEADWWASRTGREYVKQQSATASSKGSKLLASFRKKSSVQIALRLPDTDIEQARKIAARKGIGYQTLLKMLVHEGLEREAKRA